MTAKQLFYVAAVLLVFLAVSATGGAQESRELKILYIDRTNDPYYRSQTGYTGVLRKDRLSPFAAAELAARDSAVAARAAGFNVVIERISLEEDEDVIAGLAPRIAAGSIAAVVLDLPRADTVKVAKALLKASVPIFNPRHRDEALRFDTCKTGVFHTIPEWTMLTDALAQTLMANNWRNILVLEGPKDEDKVFAESVVASARKFGLRMVDRRLFVAGNDPRKRDQINVKLLTAGPDFDVVVVADTGADFGRSVSFNTIRPRPMAGTHGLVAVAWHPYWERHGAPQLNRRYYRITGRPMSEEDWATWVSVRAVADAAILAKTVEPRALITALQSPAFKLEVYKAFPGSFRSWNQQLRQTILVGTHDTIVTIAPVDGALHQINNLDTLGLDEPQFKCLQ